MRRQSAGWLRQAAPQSPSACSVGGHEGVWVAALSTGPYNAHYKPPLAKSRGVSPFSGGDGVSVATALVWYTAEDAKSVLTMWGFTSGG